MDDQINESLGRKLADLELNESEAEALVVALGGQVHTEVAGFQHGPGGPDISKVLIGQIGRADWFVADSFSFGVEREMKESGE